ncbi:hypothetical protein FAM09_21020 [Niastella caeni]|uniref:Uncharacterized protein n=1 Tax=Niastella caeni TaxID=2569763 RepID=A0A4S8HKS3_9BACT|nr:hypothetical protein [Niastella caeni]THU35878.1 hypothetical protein FAM09_21020 [Niastella caeni]
MRPQQATLAQIVLVLILILTIALTPAIREFIFNNKEWLIVVVCITGIVFIQALKTIYSAEKRLKSKIKQQTESLNASVLSGSFNSRLLKDFVIPELFEQNPDACIARLHACGISIHDMKSLQIDQNIIARLELFYYLGKAKEQQDLLNAAKKANGDTVNTPILKEITGETTDNSSSYTLRPVSA